MPLTIVSSNSASGTSVTIPTHQVGDLIVIVAYRDGSLNLPGKPTASGNVPAWEDIHAATGGNTNSHRSACFVATGTSTESGTWSNATGMAVVVLRGQKSGTGTAAIGDHASGGGTQNGGATSPNITPQVTDGSSVQLHVHMHRTVTAWNAAPTGFTRQTAVATELAVNTRDDTSVGTGVSQTGTTTNSGYRGHTIEILADPPPTFTATAALTFAPLSVEAEATFEVDTDEFIATAALTLGELEVDASAEFDAPVYQASADLEFASLEMVGVSEEEREPDLFGKVFGGRGGVFNLVFVPVEEQVVATASLTLGELAVDAEASFEAGTKTATADLTVAPLVVESEATFTAPVFEATAALTFAELEVSASANFAAVIRSATAALTIAGLSVSASAEFTAPIYEATAALVLADLQVDATAEFEAPVYDATADLTFAPLVVTAQAQFAAAISLATAELTAAALDVSASAAFDPGTKTATAELIFAALQVSASAEFTSPTSAATADLVFAPVEVAASATFAAPVFTSSAALTFAPLQIAASAEFTAPVFEASAMLVFAELELFAEAVHSPPLFTATAALTTASLLVSASGQTSETGVATATAHLVFGALEVGSVASAPFVFGPYHTVIVNVSMAGSSGIRVNRAGAVGDATVGQSGSSRVQVT